MKVEIRKQIRYDPAVRRLHGHDCQLEGRFSPYRIYLVIADGVQVDSFLYYRNAVAKKRKLLGAK